MRPTRPDVLFVGQSDFHEFAEPVAWLDQHTRLDTAGSVAAALQARCRRQTPWHTVVFAQSRPGQFSEDDVQRVSQSMPLAHLVGLLGSWCEGELRSGRPWPGVVRVYWHQWVARASAELRLDVRPTSWQLPRTYSEAERTSYALQRPPRTGAGLLAIDTDSATMFDAVAHACHLAGYSAVWMRSDRPWNVSGVTAVLWDGQLPRGRDFSHLRRVAARMAPAPVVALLGFPRHDDVHEARAQGASAVLPTPFPLPDLWHTLSEVTRRPAE